jgi:hypothetical protein
MGHDRLALPRSAPGPSHGRRSAARAARVYVCLQPHRGCLRRNSQLAAFTSGDACNGHELSWCDRDLRPAKPSLRYRVGRWRTACRDIPNRSATSTTDIPGPGLADRMVTAVPSGSTPPTPIGLYSAGPDRLEARPRVGPERRRQHRAHFCLHPRLPHDGVLTRVQADLQDRRRLPEARPEGRVRHHPGPERSPSR